MEAGAVCVTGGPLIIKSTIATECINVENYIQHKLIAKGKKEPFYAWIFRRKIIEELGGFDERLKQGEDKDFFLRIKKAGFQIGLVPGINWKHRRDQDTWPFIMRCYKRGKTRILFLIKHRKFFEFFKGVGLLWAIIFLLFLSIFSNNVIYLVPSIVGVGIIYKFFWVFNLAKDYDKKKYVLIYPFFSMSKYYSTALGYSIGLLRVIYRSVLNKPIDWSHI
jgi:hypothetical protein